MSTSEHIRIRAEDIVRHNEDVDAATAMHIFSLAGQAVFWVALLATFAIGVVLSYQWFSYAARPVMGVAYLLIYVIVSATFLLGMWGIVTGVI